MDALDTAWRDIPSWGSLTSRASAVGQCALEEGEQAFPVSLQCQG